jgi:hypothetical protein
MMAAIIPSINQPTKAVVKVIPPIHTQCGVLYFVDGNGKASRHLEHFVLFIAW